MSCCPQSRYNVALLGAMLVVSSCAAELQKPVDQSAGDRATVSRQGGQESWVLDTQNLAIDPLVPIEASSDEPTQVAEAPLSDSTQVLFFCRTAQDKLIAVYDEGTTIQYVFGPDEQPELVLNVPRAEASTYQWQGIGRYENYSISIPNGNTLYSVFWARDRLELEQPPEAGVMVEINGEFMTTVDCATDIFHNMIGVDLSPTPL